MSAKPSETEWYNLHEATKTSLPYFLTFWTLKHFPNWFTTFLARFISIFYFIFVRRARVEIFRYQKNLKAFSPAFKKIRALRQLTSYAITIIEKIDCWTNPVPLKNIHFEDDDISSLIDRLNSGRGAFVMISHLGNFEVLRSLANANEMGIKKNIPISILSDSDNSSNFTKAIKSLNPDFLQNLVNVNKITPATIERLSDTINNGGLVVCAGDRISKSKNERILVEPFLGKDAPFSYGAFFLADLIGAPLYYVWCFRNNDIVFKRDFQMCVKKSLVELGGPRKGRDQRINLLCKEFVQLLESFVQRYPFQWYNFFNFWLLPHNPEAEKNGN